MHEFSEGPIARIFKKFGQILPVLLLALLLASCSPEFASGTGPGPLSQGNEPEETGSINTEFDVIDETDAVITTEPTIIEIEDPALKEIPDSPPSISPSDEIRWAVKQLDQLKKLISPILAADSELFPGEDVINCLRIPGR